MSTHLPISSNAEKPATTALVEQALALHPAGFCVVKADRRVAFANSVAEKVLRLKRTQEDPPEWVTAPGMNGLWRGADGLQQRILRTRKPATEPSHTVHWPDGSHKVLCIQATPLLDQNGGLCGIAFTFLDVTDETARSMRALQMQLDQVHKAHQGGLSAVAVGVAQSLNELLCSIVGESEQALRTLNTQAPAHGHMRRALRSARKVAEVNKQLLLFSGKDRLAISRQEPSKLLLSFRSQLERLLTPHVELAWELDRDVPAIEVDQVQLQRAIESLVCNAVQASPRFQRGGIHIRTCAQFLDADRLRTLEHRSHKAKPGRYVLIEVVDHGTGVDPVVQKRMFEPFFSTRTQQRGMGLSAAAGVARAHGGFITITSLLGRGTTIQLGLPAMTDNAAKRQTRTSSPSRMRVGVLVVDDEPTVRNVAAMLLARASATTYLAADGESALQLYAAEQEHIDVALIDMTMPGMNGTEVMTALRRSNPELPIVLMSGFGAEHLCTPDAITRSLAKPFGREQMFNALQAVLGHTRERPAQRSRPSA